MLAADKARTAAISRLAKPDLVGHGRKLALHHAIPLGPGVSGADAEHDECNSNR